MKWLIPLICFILFNSQTAYQPNRQTVEIDTTYTFRIQNTQTTKIKSWKRNEGSNEILFFDVDGTVVCRIYGQRNDIDVLIIEKYDFIYTEQPKGKHIRF